MFRSMTTHRSVTMRWFSETKSLEVHRRSQVFWRHLKAIWIDRWALSSHNFSTMQNAWFRITLRKSMIDSIVLATQSFRLWTHQKAIVTECRTLKIRFNFVSPAVYSIKNMALRSNVTTRSSPSSSIGFWWNKLQQTELLPKLQNQCQKSRKES